LGTFRGRAGEQECKTKPICARRSLALNSVEKRTCEKNRRVLGVRKQSQFGALRLLRRPRRRTPPRVGPRNDVRALGSLSSGPSGGAWGSKNAKQSQFSPAGIRAKPLIGNGLWNLPAVLRIGKTKPIWRVRSACLRVGRASPLAIGRIEERRARTCDPRSGRGRALGRNALRRHYERGRACKTKPIRTSGKRW
jgi:hypothetical protein